MYENYAGYIRDETVTSKHLTGAIRKLYQQAQVGKIRSFIVFGD